MPQENMKITPVESTNNQVKVIKVEGRVDSIVAEQFGDYLGTVLEEGFNKFVLLLHVEYMSSAGLREMMAFLRDVRIAQGDVRVAELSERMQSIMILSGIDTSFKIFEFRQEAQESFETK